jgi:putative transposase
MTYKRCCLRQDISLSDLMGFYRKEKDTKAKERLLALVQIKKGKTTRQVGDMFSKDWSTIAKLVIRFNKEGFEGMRNKPKAGRPTKAVKDSFEAIKEDLSKSPEIFGYKQQFWSTKLLRKHIKDHYKADYTERHIIRLFHEFGYSLIKPRPNDYRKSPAKKQDFKESFKKRAYWIKQ